MYYKNKNFLIYGIEKSGLASIGVLLKKGCSITVFDDNIEKLKNASNNLNKSILFISDRNVVFDRIKEFDYLLLSPAISIDNGLCIKAKENGVSIIGELQLALNNITNPVVSVTGTNGKTTTVNIINNILKRAKFPCYLAGNVGIPLCDQISKDNEDVAILEISSFQMETTYTLKPDIAVVLNVTPNHLDRHYKMQYYSYLKKKTLLNQRDDDYCVLNYDDEIVNKFSVDVKSKVIWFSLKHKVDGAYLLNDDLYFFDEKIISINQIKLKGLHNIANVLASICVTKLLGVDNNSIIKALVEYDGEKYRIEFVKNVNGVDYVNDSKSTNTFSTIACVDSIKKDIILLLGGKSKGEKYDNLIQKIINSNVKHMVLYGETKFDILKCATSYDYINVTVCNDFVSAVEVASRIAKNGDCVVLSPACSSKDEFLNFEERGETFNKIINGINEKSKKK